MFKNRFIIIGWIVAILMVGIVLWMGKTKSPKPIIIEEVSLDSATTETTHIEDTVIDYITLKVKALTELDSIKQVKSAKTIKAIQQQQSKPEIVRNPIKIIKPVNDTIIIVTKSMPIFKEKLFKDDIIQDSLD
jgi:hypothetical protein